MECRERRYPARANGLLTIVDRIDELKEKLIQRIRPFVDAKNPGHAEDAETKAFEARIRTEAEDLKLESFGIEVRGFSSLCLHVFAPLVCC